MTSKLDIVIHNSGKLNFIKKVKNLITLLLVAIIPNFRNLLPNSSLFLDIQLK